MSNPDGDAVAAVHHRLRARGETVATSESLTAGLLAAALTDTPGSSATFRGGLVVYATDLKATLGGVPADLLAAHGPVSAPVAAALADAVRRTAGATWGVALTGVAGPDPQDGHPPGTVFAAVAGPGGATLADRLDGGATSRAAVRAAAVRLALGLLRAALDAAAPPGEHPFPPLR